MADDAGDAWQICVTVYLSCPHGAVAVPLSLLGLSRKERVDGKSVLHMHGR